MSAEDCESPQETLHPFSTCANAVHILRGLAEARDGVAQPTDLEALAARFGAQAEAHRQRRTGRQVKLPVTFVYDIQSDVITIIACRFYYDDH